MNPILTIHPTARIRPSMGSPPRKGLPNHRLTKRRRSTPRPSIRKDVRIRRDVTKVPERTKSPLDEHAQAGGYAPARRRVRCHFLRWRSWTWVIAHHFIFYLPSYSFFFFFPNILALWDPSIEITNKFISSNVRPNRRPDLIGSNPDFRGC